MRITKTIAQVTARAMVAKKWEEYRAKYRLFGNLVRDEHYRNLPKPIITLAKKHPEYLSMTDSISLGEGFGYGSVSFDEPMMPANHVKTYFDCRVNKLRFFKGKHFDLMTEKKEIGKLQKEIESALYQLKISKRVLASLPEAVPFLPTEASMGLQVMDYTKLRTQINA